MSRVVENCKGNKVSGVEVSVNPLCQMHLEIFDIELDVVTSLKKEQY